ncbi:hypothetical protein EVAR_28615_1 [Eumeta japonica]|uniref:Uncharacterized protein n=1 Tax=Eumeta variegata TaxID=151549 RepID=A0A4C1XTC6_EUMVA|nr:hypothetical protein EVAR_28615_1 [Eumeta japonica]
MATSKLQGRGTQRGEYCIAPLKRNCQLRVSVAFGSPRRADASPPRRASTDLGVRSRIDSAIRSLDSAARSLDSAAKKKGFALCVIGATCVGTSARRAVRCEL